MRRACLAALLLLALPARADDIVSGISQNVIEIKSNYTGSDIVVFGSVENAHSVKGRDIVVVVRGPEQPMTVRRRDRVAGVWVNRDAAKFEGLPGYYYLASTQPLDRIAAPRALTQYGVGVNYLQPTVIGSHHDPHLFLEAAKRHLKQARLYAEAPGDIDFQSENLFSTHVPVPAAAPRGQYNVEVYLFRDGQVVSAQSTPLFIDQTGLERQLFNLAHNAPWFYGLACVFMAMLLGWISSVLLRRPT
jgi:uncharacterized protein (TIGR02186 family)